MVILLEYLNVDCVDRVDSVELIYNEIVCGVKVGNQTYQLSDRQLSRGFDILISSFDKTDCRLTGISLFRK